MIMLSECLLLRRKVFLAHPLNMTFLLYQGGHACMGEPRISTRNCVGIDELRRLEAKGRSYEGYALEGYSGGALAEPAFQY